MKKLITIGFMALAIVANAASYVEQPFINGWNLYITNGTGSLTGVGSTNLLYTTVQGQIVYSLTNNTINGIVNTNTIANDAYDNGGNILAFNENGDIVANAAIHYYINQTNWIPIAVTNSQGQYFTSNSWPLWTSQYPTYMYPASTNVYPSLPNASATNLITFYFQRGWAFNLGSTPIRVWDTSTNVFSFSIVGTGFTPLAGITNLPIAFTQGANRVRLSNVIATTNANGVSCGLLINQVSLGQPNP